MSVKISVYTEDEEWDMILIIGGAYQGQEEQARILLQKQQIHGEEWRTDRRKLQIHGEEQRTDRSKLQIHGEEQRISQEEWRTDREAQSNEWEKPPIHEEECLMLDIHLRIAQELRAGRNPRALFEEILRKQPDIILTCNELGCGIVPVDAFDRMWREETGRICCWLAKEAQAVYRMCCGIGTRIK